MAYKFTVSLSSEEMNSILNYGDKDIHSITLGELSKILENMENGIKERLADDPHYAFKDFVESVLT